MSDMFTFRDTLEPEADSGLQKQAGGGAGPTEEADLAGFKVESNDGHIGTVMEASRQAGESYLVVDTGATIFSRRVMLPAGLVERIDRDHRTIHVSCSHDDIKQAPEFDEARYTDAAYRHELGGYYSS